MSSLAATFIEGLAISFGLIVAIGPQNAYVLRKGLKRRHVFSVATTCFLADAFLIALAAAGVGALVAGNPGLARIAAWGGFLFLLWYGWRSFRAARHPHVISEDDIDEAGKIARGKGVWSAVGVALALTFLNPHVYLDTLVILGGLAAQHPAGTERAAFAIGAITSSAIWFYGLGYGARLLVPVFRRPRAWQVLDVLIGVIMWTMAVHLLNQARGG